MRRIVAAALTAVAFVLGACEDDSGDGGGTYGYYYDACRQFSSCGTCTPVEGCGWCFDSDGTGMCAASPDECATPAFSWTWNSSGCRIPADAGSTQTGDAGAPPIVTVAVPEDAGPEDDAGSADAGATPVDAASADGGAR